MKNNIDIKSATKSVSNLTKSKKKPVEIPIYEVSLKFSNNLFQAFLFEIFERLKIDLIPVEFKSDDVLLENLVRITFQDEIFFILFIEKTNIKDWVSNSYLFNLVEKLMHLTNPKNITVIFFEIPHNFKFNLEDQQISKEELIFFLNIEIRAKVYDCNHKNDLVDFIGNYADSIITRGEKSKITFFDAKPVNSTNLCETEGITDENSIMLVKHLMCIPGVSERKAISVVKNYPTLSSLMSIYNSNQYNDNEKENLLRDVEIFDKSKNTTKRLGGALSAKIYKCFYSDNPDTIIN